MKYKKAITALALAALLLAGCAAPQAVQAPAPQQTAKAAETQSGVTFTDDMGYPVTVQSWNRVVSLYGSFAEAWTLAGGTLAATTEDAIKERGLDLGTDIAVIGTNQDPNTEEILAQNPDFVILNAEVSEQTALHEFLQEAGVPHAYFKTNTFDEYLAMLRTFCDMTGREDLYEQNGLAVQQQISDVLELVQNAKLPAPDVLLLRAYSSGCKAKGSDNMTGAMLKDLGAINIADADDSLLENLSMENIIADDPEDIFVVTMGASQQKALDWLAENLQANPAWSGLSAVQSGHYYLLDKALFHYKPNARWGESYRTLRRCCIPSWLISWRPWHETARNTTHPAQAGSRADRFSAGRGAGSFGRALLWQPRLYPFAAVAGMVQRRSPKRRLPRFAACALAPHPGRTAGRQRAGGSGRFAAGRAEQRHGKP